MQTINEHYAGKMDHLDCFIRFFTHGDCFAKQYVNDIEHLIFISTPKIPHYMTFAKKAIL